MDQKNIFWLVLAVLLIFLWIIYATLYCKRHFWIHFVLAISSAAILFSAVLIKEPLQDVILYMTMLFIAVGILLQHQSLDLTNQSLTRADESFKLAWKQFESQNRPYVQPYLAHDKDYAMTNDRILINFRAKNTGNVPAQNFKSDFKWKLPQESDQWKNTKTEQQGQAILFPDQRDLSLPQLKIEGQGVHDIRALHVKVVLSYDGVETKGHKTEVEYKVTFKLNTQDINKSILEFSVVNGHAT